MTEELSLPERDPWERADNETAAEYAAFQKFCMLGSKRTLRLLASHTDLSLETIKLYSRTHKWIERSKSLDLSANEIIATNIEISPTETMAAQYAVGKIMLELGVKAINLKKPGTIKISDAIKLIDKGSELQRKAQGLDSGMTVNFNGKGFEAVQDLLDMIEGEVVDEEEI